MSINPGISVSTTARWGKETQIINNDDITLNIEEDAKLQFPYANDKEINDMIKTSVDITEYRIGNISAYDDFPEPEYNKNGTPKDSYYLRDNNGYIWYISPNGSIKPLGGITTRYWDGFNYTSDISLSRIRNQYVFRNVINHELTHAYINSHYLRNWGGSEDEYKKFSESSAYIVEGRTIPSIYKVNMLIVNLARPPHLIPNSKALWDWYSRLGLSY